MSERLERRFIDAEAAEIRAAEDGSRKVSGYFAVYNRWSPVYGNFRERIAPGFFDSVLGNDVRALFNHDDSRLLGRSKAGTLRLASDETGLHGEIEPIPETPTGAEVIENLRLRNLTGASFAFSLPAKEGDVWAKAADGVWERTLIRAAGLFDVSVVTNPFYPDTAVGLRSALGLDEAERSLAEWQKATRDGSDWIREAEHRLRLLEIGVDRRSRTV